MADCPHCGRKMPERDVSDSDLQEMKTRWDGFEAARRGEPIQCGKTLGLGKTMLLQWESGWQIGQQAEKFAGVKIS